jgi:hypothetical protein
MKPQTTNIIFLAVGLILGFILFRGCGGVSKPTTSGEVIKSDTIFISKFDTVTLTDLKYITKHTTKEVPLIDTFTQIQLDTLYLSYNDTNIYYIDTNNVRAQINVSQNKIFKATFINEKETQIITNIIEQKRFQILVGAGLQYPFGAFVGGGFKTKKDLQVQYQYSTTNNHSIGAFTPIRLRK